MESADQVVVTLTRDFYNSAPQKSASEDFMSPDARRGASSGPLIPVMTARCGQECVNCEAVAPPWPPAASQTRLRGLLEFKLPGPCGGKVRPVDTLLNQVEVQVERSGAVSELRDGRVPLVKETGCYTMQMKLNCVDYRRDPL
ncbi:hypothetical protein J6590_046013 [Homalodisca vitripennis]|nr:hypothetical protein J6590_046013 [Homalodisca vitripennis]